MLDLVVNPRQVFSWWGSIMLLFYCSGITKRPDFDLTQLHSGSNHPSKWYALCCVCRKQCMSKQCVSQDNEWIVKILHPLMLCLSKQCVLQDNEWIVKILHPLMLCLSKQCVLQDNEWIVKILHALMLRLSKQFVSKQCVLQDNEWIVKILRMYSVVYTSQLQGQNRTLAFSCFSASSQKHLRTIVTPNLHLTKFKRGEIWGWFWKDKKW